MVGKYADALISSGFRSNFLMYFSTDGVAVAVRAITGVFGKIECKSSSL